MNVANGQSAGKDLKSKEELFHHISGFVDGEGAFPIQIRKTPWTKFGFSITPEFSVSQHKDYREIIDIVKNTFECGTISVKGGQPNMLVWVVKSRKTITEKIIPFFKKYRLIVKKTKFKQFCDIIERLNKNEHETKEGFDNLVNLVFEMKGKGKRRRTKEEILGNPQRLYVENH